MPTSYREVKSLIAKGICITPQTIPSLMAVFRRINLENPTSQVEVKKLLLRRFSNESVFQQLTSTEVFELIQPCISDNHLNLSCIKMIQSWVSNFGELMSV